MSKTFLTLFAASTIALSIAACDTVGGPTSRDPGVYKTTTTSKSPSGTKTTQEKTTSVYRDQYGNKKATVKEETTTDPKGLFNKEKTTTVKTYN